MRATRDIEGDLPENGTPELISLVQAIKVDLPKLREKWLTLCKREIFGELEEGTHFEHNIKHFKLKY